MPDPFANEEYVSLETVRKNGTPVARPIWVAPQGDKLVMITNSDTWKVKHIRRNPAVRVASCDSRGGSVGAYRSATARILDGDEATAPGVAAIKKKYGWKTVPFSILGMFMRKERVVIEVVMDPASSDALSRAVGGCH